MQLYFPTFIYLSKHSHGWTGLPQPKIKPISTKNKNSSPLISYLFFWTTDLSSPLLHTQTHSLVSFELLRKRKRKMGTINQGISLFDEPQNIINPNNTNHLGLFFSFPNQTLSSSSSSSSSPPSSLVSPFLSYHSLNSFLHNNSSSFVIHPQDPINLMANLPETLISISSLSSPKQRDLHDGIVNTDHHCLTGGISSQRPSLNPW